MERKEQTKTCSRCGHRMWFQYKHNDGDEGQWICEQCGRVEDGALSEETHTNKKEISDEIIELNKDIHVLYKALFTILSKLRSDEYEDVMEIIGHDLEDAIERKDMAVKINGRS